MSILNAIEQAPAPKPAPKKPVEIGDRVQAVLHHPEGTPRVRAVAAEALIEEHVRHETGLDWDVALPLPIEWQHRVPISSVDTEPLTIAFNAEYDGDEALAEAAWEALWAEKRL